MATKPIKNDLFRFITFRTPQLIREERKELGFLYHPDIESSFFYTNLDPNLTNEEKRTAVRSKASTFSNPLKSYLEVKKLSKKLYNFSTWLTANRETLTKSEVDERMNEVTSVSNAKRILIWDNFL